VASKYDYFAKVNNWTAFYKRNDWLPEPVIHATALCIADEVFNPFTGAKMGITKENFLYIIIGLNFFCLVVSIFFFWVLEVRTKEYIEIFDKRNVEMRDFTIRVGNLPNDNKFDYKDLLL
jgi:hypothetical protein